jgi:hypothetical protein
MCIFFKKGKMNFCVSTAHQNNANGIFGSNFQLVRIAKIRRTDINVNFSVEM